MLDLWSFILLPVLWLLAAPILALVFASKANRRAREALAKVEALERQLAAAPPVVIRAGGVVPAIRAGDPFGSAPTDIDAADIEPADIDPADFGADLSDAAAADGRPALADDAVEADRARAAEAAAVATPEPVNGPARERESLESRIGARWSVLVGGLALALGAIFLVRYSIEAGLLGPAMRVGLGFVLSAALFAAGEAMRRRDRARGAPAFARADVPAILTGAGGVAAFATIYAAYALYGFLGDAAAFVLLTAAGLATLFLSVIHGPALAGLGALGSYAAPLLVSSDAPQPLPVVLHVLAVTAAVLGMARIRHWRWLAIAGIAASLIWGVLIGLIGNVGTNTAELLLVAGLTALYAGALVAGPGSTSLRDRPPNRLALAALASVAALSLFYGLINDAYPALAAGLALAGALAGIASCWSAVSPAAIIAAIVAVATIMLIRSPVPAEAAIMRVGAIEWFVLGGAGLGSFAIKAASVALMMAVGSFLSADRAASRAPRAAGAFAAAGAGTPLLVLAIVYLRHASFETRPLIGLTALALAAIFAVTVERLIARRPADFAAPAPAFYAVGAVLALTFAMAVGLQTRFIPLALSLGAAGIAWVFLHRPVAALPPLAVVSAALACVALVAGPPLSPEALGTAPILNGLVVRFGLPALSVLAAGEMLRRHRDGIAAGLLQAIGLALAALFVALEIRHWANGGVLTAGAPGLGEQSALTLAALGFSLGLQRIAARTASPVYRGASLAAGIVGAAVIVAAHFITANPLFTGEDVGAGRVLNLLLPGYLLPAILAAWIAAAARGVRPRPYVLGLAALSLALGFAYLTFMVRHAFHGGRLDAGPVTDAENWTYSAVWLAFCIGLLAAGIGFRSAAVRAASGLIVAVVIGKVFLFDMAALTGALRAVSFLGLGAVLIVIGRLYQRLLAGGGASAPAATEA